MNKKLIIVLIVIIIGAVLYFAFNNGEPSGDSLLNSRSGGVNNDILGKDINVALNKINSLNITNEIFRDPNFQILVDYSIVIPSQTRGRENPFLDPDPDAAGTGGVVVDSLNPEASLQEALQNNEEDTEEGLEEFEEDPLTPDSIIPEEEPEVTEN